jgi:hypothetical protein
MVVQLVILLYLELFHWFYVEFKYFLVYRIFLSQNKSIKSWYVVHIFLIYKNTILNILSKILSIHRKILNLKDQHQVYIPYNPRGNHITFVTPRYALSSSSIRFLVKCGFLFLFNRHSSVVRHVPEGRKKLLK